MARFGPPTIYDSSYGESMHKDLKGNAKRTQKRADLFDFQIANRHVETIAVQMAWNSINPASHRAVIYPDIKAVADFKCLVNSPYFVVNEDGMFVHRSKLISRSKAAVLPLADWSNKRLMQQVTEYIQINVLPKIKPSSLDLMTQAKVSGCLYRPFPTYNKQHDAKLPRHDWVYATWPGYGAVAAQIITFLHRQSSTGIPF